MGLGRLFLESSGCQKGHADGPGTEYLSRFGQASDNKGSYVVNDAGMFHSAALDQNDTYQFKFDNPGSTRCSAGYTRI